LELRQLAYFVAVADDESFTRAAQRLHVAQPGVSQQIRRLEAELGTQLFDRAGRRPRLTAAGNALLPHARDALAAREAGRASVVALDGVVTGRVRVGSIPGIPSVDLPRLLSAFLTANPHVEVTLREDQPLALLEHLRRGDYDAVIVGLSSSHPPDGLSLEELSVESLVLVTSPAHPLAARDVASVNELRGETFVTLTRGTALRRHVEQACEESGFAARIALETTDVHRLCELVAHGLGVTIVPRSIADQGTTAGLQLCVLEIEPSVVQRHTALVWKTDRDPSAAASAFLAAARNWSAGQA
jgi:DNA-binding transcriptional LysR family regulator